MSHRIPPSMDEADACLPLEVPRWFVVRLKPQADQRARQGVEEVLKPFGLRAYLPNESCWRRQGRAKRAVLRPLLAGYLFAEATTAQLYALNEVDGVEGVLIRGVRPATVAWFVEVLAFCESLGLFDHTTPYGAGPPPTFRRGDQVKIIAGLFSGFMGEVAKVKGQNRLGVVVKAMGRCAPGPLDLATDQVEPVSRAA